MYQDTLELSWAKILFPEVVSEYTGRPAFKRPSIVYTPANTPAAAGTDNDVHAGPAVAGV